MNSYEDTAKQAKAIAPKIRALAAIHGREPVTVASLVVVAGSFVATGDSEREFLAEAQDAFRHARRANGSTVRPADACPDVPAAELLDPSGMQDMADASRAILRFAEEGGLMVLGLSCLTVAALLSSEAGDSESAFGRLARLAYDTATGGLASTSSAVA